MSTPIENNTEELQELLRIANNLPEAVEPPVFQEKTVSPTTETETYTPDPDYDGFSSFTVNAMPTAEQATPSVSVSSSGLITASVTQGAGYVSAGTKSGTKQLATQGAKTITPSTSAQTAVASGVFTTDAVTVDPIPSSYVQPSGTKDITENGTHDVRNYESVNVDVATGGSDFSDDFKAVIERTAASITLPSDVTKIGERVFYGWGELQSISMPSGITSIDASAFYGCSSMKLTSLPSGLTSIGNYAFNTCTAMTITSLPSGITSIGTNAFYYCIGLISITFEGTPNTIAANSFNSCSKLITINVPWAEGAVANAPWGATNATINYNYTGG